MKQAVAHYNKISFMSHHLLNLVREASKCRASRTFYYRILSWPIVSLRSYKEAIK